MLVRKPERKCIGSKMPIEKQLEEIEDLSETELEESEDGDGDGFDEDVTLADLMQTFFASEDGKNMVDTLQGIKKSIDTHCKIMSKISASLESLASKGA